MTSKRTRQKSSAEATSGPVRCEVCGRACLIPPDGSGFCRVRTNEKGRIKLATYGRFTSCNMDPIEKKPFNHFWPGSLTMSLGSVGCNFRCAGCQNWEIACPADPAAVPTVSIAPEKAVSLAVEAEGDGISFTYNEPVVWLDFVLDCSSLAKKAGLFTSLVTNGYMSESSLMSLAKCMDAIRMDIKGTQRSYDAITSGVDAGIVRGNAEKTLKLGMHLELITNLVPGISDGEDVIRDIARWVKSDLGSAVPWHLTRFHPARKLLRLPATSQEALERSYSIAKEERLEFPYVGNVPGHGGENTWCPDCGELLMTRSILGTEDINLDGNHCPKCSRAIPITGKPKVTSGRIGALRLL